MYQSNYDALIELLWEEEKKLNIEDIIQYMKTNCFRQKYYKNRKRKKMASNEFFDIYKKKK